MIKGQAKYLVRRKITASYAAGYFSFDTYAIFIFIAINSVGAALNEDHAVFGYDIF